MKILFISMPSIHAVRWVENLSESGHELYWFDVLGKGKLPTQISIQQITEWKKRKLPYIKGEHFLRQKFPTIYNRLHPFLEVTANEKFTQILNEIQPDLVHSFEMQSCSYPILETMNKFSETKWLYSCWGSDLFYYKNQNNHLQKMKKVLSRIDFLHTDCKRDFKIANELGFEAKYVGVIPGGGGYNINYYNKFIKLFQERNVILIKGYHHLFGRALNVIKALEMIKNDLNNFEIIVFGTHQIVQDYIFKHNLPFKVYDRNTLNHEDVLKLMGKTIIYIGNSISDGIPNTLLEAMSMGAFPIQSNPGGVTSEIIKHNKNGLLIEDAENVLEIKELVLEAIANETLRKYAVEKNREIAINYLDYSVNQQKIVALYQEIEEAL